jgi:DNA mismatch endonuclease Vsr
MSSEEAPRAVHRSSPLPLSETVRRQMSAMPTRDAGTEIALRRELHRRGLRFRVQVRTLPGAGHRLDARADSRFRRRLFLASLSGSLDCT